ncbi:MAG: hypothetical protein E7655_07650 [Ruminococcaceae bacterium]|nr:hypothetical protein [Oscillospiraceae bacterium]
MHGKHFQRLILNMVKGFATLALCNGIGYLFYIMILNVGNAEDPKTASGRTAIFSLILFAASIYAFYLVAIAESSDSGKIDERKLLEDAYKDSGYALDYKAYFIEQVKTRLWGYYFAVGVGQLPLFLNFLVEAVIPGDVTIYELPIPLFKFYTTNIFAYELLGKAWFLGPVLYLLLFIPIFTYLVYREQKTWMAKPSYVK